MIVKAKGIHGNCQNLCLSGQLLQYAAPVPRRSVRYDL